MEKKIDSDLNKNWKLDGECTTTDPDQMYIMGKIQRRSKAVCKPCPVIAQCLIEALETEDVGNVHGVWGGLTERERRKILRNPPMKMWIIEQARASLS